MSVQSSANLINRPFIIGGEPCSVIATVLQDADRSGPMVRNTLMSYDPTLEVWVPFSNEAATDGTQIPSGILQAELTEAEIVAGNVANVPILVFDAIFDEGQLVIENSKTLDTIVNVPVSLNKSVRELLRWASLVGQVTTTIENFENPAE